MCIAIANCSKPVGSERNTGDVATGFQRPRKKKSQQLYFLQCRLSANERLQSRAPVLFSAAPFVVCCQNVPVAFEILFIYLFLAFFVIAYFFVACSCLKMITHPPCSGLRFGLFTVTSYGARRCWIRSNNFP